MAGAAATDPRGNSGDAGADRQETGREKNLADLTEGRDIHPGPTVRERIRSLVLSTGLRTLNWTGLSRLVGRRYRGRGTILMFHDFVKSREGTLDQGCEISVLDTLLDGLGRPGWSRRTRKSEAARKGSHWSLPPLFQVPHGCFRLCAPQRVRR